MKVNIKTYSDLENEKLRLKQSLAHHGSLIRQDVAVIREELKPVKAVLGFLGKFMSRDKNNPMVNLGVAFIGDILLRNVLFARSGFITKHVAPLLLKNLSSNVVSKAGISILHRLTTKFYELTDRFRKNPRDRSLNGFQE